MIEVDADRPDKQAKPRRWKGSPTIFLRRQQGQPLTRHKRGAEVKCREESGRRTEAGDADPEEQATLDGVSGRREDRASYVVDAKTRCAPMHGRQWSARSP